jgi:hypothetical protein
VVFYNGATFAVCLIVNRIADFGGTQRVQRGMTIKAFRCIRSTD